MARDGGYSGELPHCTVSDTIEKEGRPHRGRDSAADRGSVRLARLDGDIPWRLPPTCNKNHG